MWDYGFAILDSLNNIINVVVSGNSIEGGGYILIKRIVKEKYSFNGIMNSKKKKIILPFFIFTVLYISVFLSACGNKVDEKDSVGDTINVKNEAENSDITNKEEPSIQWRIDTTNKYMNDAKVKSLICVQAYDKTKARVLMFEKSIEDDKVIWEKTLECDGYIGKDGLGNADEYSCFTPIGDFGFLQAFGIKKNPGSKLDYIDVNDDVYCCGDEVAYNKMIDVKNTPHECDGEHLIEYSPEYNYGIFFDYNKDCISGEGFAFFLHCKGANTYTGGCVAVDEKDMIQIIKTVDENSRLIIDYMP